MTSLEPLRGKAYHEDLKWRMVYQREMLGLSYQQIASNLNVHTSTVWRTVKRFEEEQNSKLNVSFILLKCLFLWMKRGVIGEMQCENLVTLSCKGTYHVMEYTSSTVS